VGEGRDKLANSEHLLALRYNEHRKMMAVKMTFLRFYRELRTHFWCCSLPQALQQASVREYVFYVFSDFQKNMLFTFFEMTFKKNVKRRKKYQVC